MIITIDGPAGAGKSSVARALAERLGARFLDTGAMYRAVALAGLRQGVDWDRPEQLAKIAGNVDIQLAGSTVLLDGEDVSEAIRTTETTAVTRHAADNPAVRRRLVELQRAAAAGEDNVVAEGRDQGTLVFPGAECKIFLTASLEERARRRLADLDAQGEAATLQEVLVAHVRRDQEDCTREFGPLFPAADAVEVSTDGMTLDEVVQRLESLVESRKP